MNFYLKISVAEAQGNGSSPSDPLSDFLQRLLADL